MLTIGTLDKLFNDFHATFIKRSQLSERQIFRMENALVFEKTPGSNSKLWFKPNS